MSMGTGPAAHAAGGTSQVRGHSPGRAVLEVGAVTAGLAGAMGASVLALVHEARAASSTIETAARTAAPHVGTLPDGDAFDWQDVPPNADGIYLPDGGGPFGAAVLDERDRVGTRVLAMLGDSTAVGFGCRTPDELPGVVLARGAAERLGRPVRVVSWGMVGAVTADLDVQVTAALGMAAPAAAPDGAGPGGAAPDGAGPHRAAPRAPDAVAILVGANDVRELTTPRASAAHLASVVALLRARGVAVVVGTCPDLGAVVAIEQPLRRFAGWWSTALGRAQARAVSRAGGVPVSLADVVRREFYGHPELFYADRFHPSGRGYARAAAAMLPAVVDALRPAA